VSGVTQRLVQQARGIAFDDIPPDVVTVAKTCILDWLGCALAGSREPLSDILIEEAATHGAASLIGRDQRTSVYWAALVNGAASHALDYDDAHMHMSGHPTVPVASAALALGEEVKAGGRELLTAFVAGVETECRLGPLLGLGHYGVGWHNTATLGTFGATAACARLLDLDEDAWRHAFGIAGTQASGLKSVFGSMSKPFQAGKAASDGLLAARLAANGFTANPDIIETPQGVAAAYTTTFDPGALDSLKGRWLVAETLFKYHASCYLTHSAMEAAIALRERIKFGADAAEWIHVVVPPGSLAVCNIEEPQTGLEGKFSLRATVAMALCGDDTADPAAFTDERMRAPDLVSVRNRIEVVPSEDVVGTQARIEIGIAAGRTHSETVDVGRPADDVERQWSRITEKFVRLATPVLGEEAAWRLHDAVERLPDIADTSEIAALASTR
jgi:2-methylcitrate dehydratase PrpD